MTSNLSRTTESDDQWRLQFYAFARAAANRHQGILISYLLEPETGQTVPQRLYRYDLFDDYLSRHRDDFEFGFDLITRAEIISRQRTYGVYIIELDHNPNYLYVGQTWYLPEERLAQHLTGLAVFHAAKPFKRGSTGQLRPDLYRHLPRYRFQAQAETMEAQVARELTRAGFRIEGGH